MDATSIIRDLGLEPLPFEGGWFRRIYTDDVQINMDVNRPASGMASAIYFMITREGFSALHRLSLSAETFHWHAGDAVDILQLHAHGGGEKVRLGLEMAQNEVPMTVIPRNSWQGAHLARDVLGFALMSVVVTPEFLWDDFELGDRDALTEQYPDWAEDIHYYTR